MTPAGPSSTAIRSPTRRPVLPYNLIETPAEYITVTSRLSPDFNERQHPYCGLISSMHSWGLYNGRYGLSNHVLIKQFPEQERPLAERMLDGELARQKRLKAGDRQGPDARRPARRQETVSELQAAAIPRHARALLQSGASQRAQDTDVRARAAQCRRRYRGDDQAAGSGGLYLVAVSLRAERRGVRVCRAPGQPRQHETNGGWSEVLKSAPTEWERFWLVPA